MNDNKKEKSWIWILLLILLFGIGITLFFRGCDSDTGKDESQVEQDDSSLLDSDTSVLFEDELLSDSLTFDSVDVATQITDSLTGELSDTIEVIPTETIADKSKDKEDADLQKQQLSEVKKHQEELRREAEEQRLKKEAEEAERKRIEEEENRLAAEDAERQRQIAEAEARVMNEGILNGLFSVSTTTKVRFSQGNLQYQASTDTWRFATNQWDFEGLRNENIDPDNVGWIDLFGWGTSGYNKKYPFMISRNAGDYVSGERNIANTQYDWGVYNAISNGGGKENLWRVLSHIEWRYLFCKRKNADKLFTFATVNGVKGLVLLPDNWQTPAGVNLELSINKGMKYVGDDEYINNIPKVSFFDHNVLTINNWRILEEAGAVFLPAAGGRDYANVFEAQVCGFYWSTTRVGMREAYMIGFSAGNFVASDFELRNCGFSVRLVRDVKVEK